MEMKPFLGIVFDQSQLAFGINIKKISAIETFCDEPFGERFAEQFIDSIVVDWPCVVRA